MKIYLNKDYKCIGVDDNSFVANSNTQYIRFYFMDDGAFGLVTSLDDAEVYDNTSVDYVSLAFKRSDGCVIQHFMGQHSAATETTPYYEYEISQTDGVLYKKGALEISAQFVKATLKSDGGTNKGTWAANTAYNVKDYVSYTLNGTAIRYVCIKTRDATSTTTPNNDTEHFAADYIVSRNVFPMITLAAHVMDNIGTEAQEYYAQYEADNEAAHELMQVQISRNINNIGNLTGLTTDVKSTIVGAINEVDAHTDTNTNNIATNTTNIATNTANIATNTSNISALNTRVGANANLETTEKGTIVGAINEVKDSIEDGVLNIKKNGTTIAIFTANDDDSVTADIEVPTVINNLSTSDTENALSAAQGKILRDDVGNMSTMSSEITATNVVGAINQVIDKVNGKSTSIGLASLQAVVTTFNSATSSYLKTGDNVFVVQTNVPDLWISGVESTSTTYTYTTDQAFIDTLTANGYVQVGYYKLSYLETIEGVNTIAWQNLSVPTSAWVSDSTLDGYDYKATITLTSFVDYTVTPFVTFGATEANSGNYAPVVKAVQSGVEIYAKSIPTSAIEVKTIITFKAQSNTNSAGGQSWTNKGQWVSGTSYKLYDLVYNASGLFLCKEAVQGTTQPQSDLTHWDYVYASPTVISAYDDLTNKPILNADLDSITPTANTYYRHNGSSATTYTIGKIYFYNGTEYKALDGSATSSPVTYAKTTGSLPTSGWNTYLPTGTIADNYQFSKPGTYTDVTLDDLAPADTYTDYTDINNWKGSTFEDEPIYSVTASSSYITLTFIYSSHSVKIKLYNDGHGVCDADGMATYGSYQYTLILKISKTAVTSGYVNTIEDSNIKVNSTATLFIEDSNKITPYSKTNGMLVVHCDTLPTTAISYDMEIADTSSEGLFEIVNSYLPTIPTIPTELPQTTGNLTSGSLPNDSTEWTANTLMFSFTHTGSSSSKNIVSLAKSINPLMISGQQYRVKIYSGTEVVSNTLVTAQTGSSGCVYIDTPAYNYIYRVFQEGKLKAGATTMGQANIEQASGYTTYGIAGLQGSFSSEQTVYITIESQTVASYTYAITDSNITANSDIDFSINDDTSYNLGLSSRAVGSFTLIRDSVPTTAISYTYKVKQTSGSGQFNLLNSYVPDAQVQSNWTETDTTSKAYIQNKPTVVTLGSYVVYTSGSSTLSAGNYDFYINDTTNTKNIYAGIIRFDGSTAVQKLVDITYSSLGNEAYFIKVSSAGLITFEVIDLSDGTVTTSPTGFNIYARTLS